MREIKFRAWDSKHRKMIYDFSETLPHPDGDSLLSYILTQNEDLQVILMPEGEQYELLLLQFTGLHDRNNKEIWEGDIVTVVNWLNGEPWQGHIHNCEVEFKEGRFELKDHWMHESLATSDVVLIGNIYENPELI